MVNLNRHRVVSLTDYYTLIDYELYPDGLIVLDEIDPNDLEPDAEFYGEDFGDEFLPEG